MHLKRNNIWLFKCPLLFFLIDRGGGVAFKMVGSWAVQDAFAGNPLLMGKKTWLAAIASELTLDVSHLKRVIDLEDHRRTLQSQASKQKGDDEFNIFLKHQARKSYRWQQRHSFARDSAAIINELCCFPPKRSTDRKKARQKPDGCLEDQAL